MDASGNGNYTVDFYALPINGTFDQNNDNDTLSVNFEVLSYCRPRSVG